jgi:hypothetical protein
MSSDRTAVEGKRGLRELYREERKLSNRSPLVRDQVQTSGGTVDTAGNPAQKTGQSS